MIHVTSIIYRTLFLACLRLAITGERLPNALQVLFNALVTNMWVPWLSTIEKLVCCGILLRFPFLPLVPKHPSTLCTHRGFLTVGVEAAAWPGCSIWLPAFSCKFSRKLALGTCPCASRPSKLAQSLPCDFRWRHFFCNGSSMMSTCMSTAQADANYAPHFWGAAFLWLFFVQNRLHEVCPPGSGRTACSRPFVTTILWDSLNGPGMKILFKVLDNSLCKALVKILLKWGQRPLHDLVQVLVSRYCRDPVEILLKRSLQKDPEDLLSLRWCTYESSSGFWEAVIVRRSYALLSSDPYRSYCSIPTVACIWYTGFLPSTLFGLPPPPARWGYLTLLSSFSFPPSPNSELQIAVGTAGPQAGINSRSYCALPASIIQSYNHTITQSHIYIHTCIHACMHTCIHAYLHAYGHVCWLRSVFLWGRRTAVLLEQVSSEGRAAEGICTPVGMALTVTLG